MALRRRLFHPLTVLATSLASAAVFALLIAWRSEGELRLYLLSYFVPVAVPFVAFLFDRAARWPGVRWPLDLPVVGLALLRMVVPVPLISGHALFLTYAALTARLGVARMAAVAVLLEVAYLKIFAWEDPTLLGGTLLGALAAYAYRRKPGNRPGRLTADR